MPSAVARARFRATLLLERFARSERRRVPEPMVMDDQESVAAFHVADPILQLPIYRFNALAMSALLPEGGSLLDLGSGSARLLAHVGEARPDIRAVGTDLAETMLATGRVSLKEAGLDNRISLRQADMTELPADLPSDIDLVSTVWALHHLPTEEHLHRCLREIARLRETTGCAVWIFDFARLHRNATFKAIVNRSPQAPQRLREDGIASERAAWSFAELRAALDAAGLGDLTGGPERRVGHLQAYFALPRNGRPSGHAANWAAPALPSASEGICRRLREGIQSPAD
jgi:tRNA (cmo5U34)-methyltransferase